MVLLQGSVHGRDDALAEGVVERVGQDAVARGDVALDGDVEQRSGIELVGGDVDDAWHRLDRIIYFLNGNLMAPTVPSTIFNSDGNACESKQHRWRCDASSAHRAGHRSSC
jgi:hypothetical protein